MHNTDRRLGLGEVDVGVQKNRDVLVSRLQGYRECSAAVLKITQKRTSQGGFLKLPDNRKDAKQILSKNC